MNNLNLQFSTGLNGPKTHEVSLGENHIGTLLPKTSVGGAFLGYSFRNDRGEDCYGIFSDLTEFKNYISSNMSVHISVNGLFSTYIKNVKIELGE